MIGTPRGVYLHQPRSHNEPMYGGREQEAFRQHRDRVFAEIFQQRHANNYGHRSPFGHLGSRTPPMAFVPNMASMMGAHRRHGSSNPVDDFASRLGMMGGGPHTGMGRGMSMRMGFGSNRPSLSRHQPYIRQRHSPFSSYDSPGPPRAHSFMPSQRSSHRHMHSPFHHPLHSTFSSSRTTLLDDDDSDDDDFETEYFMPPRRGQGRHSRRRRRHESIYPSMSRSRRYRSNIYEDSEDEFDDYDDYEDDFDDEDTMDGYFSRPRRAARWMMRG